MAAAAQPGGARGNQRRRGELPGLIRSFVSSVITNWLLSPSRWHLHNVHTLNVITNHHHHPIPAMLQQLPQEVLDYVVDWVAAADRPDSSQTIRSCAATSRLLLPRARRHLYGSIELLGKGPSYVSSTLINTVSASFAHNRSYAVNWISRPSATASLPSLSSLLTSSSSSAT